MNPCLNFLKVPLQWNPLLSMKGAKSTLVIKPGPHLEDSPPTLSPNPKLNQPMSMPINKALLTTAEYNRARNQVALKGVDAQGYNKCLDKLVP